MEDNYLIWLWAVLFSKTVSGYAKMDDIVRI